VPRAERLRRWELADLAVIDEVRGAVEQDIEQAVTFAKESPYPPPEAAYTDLYAQTPGDAA
jgi:TPP-dependent pyruvate/acetoin dehydrogenase alpha subunit